MRTLGAGLLGGVVVFAWGVLAHLALGLGELGVSALPDEAPVVAAIAQHVPAAGLYLFPGERDPATRQATFRERPHGLLVTTPAGGELALARRLALELATNLAGALLAAWLLARLGGAIYPLRGAGVGLVLGLFVTLAVDASYQIWYDFPARYLLAQTIDQVAGWALAGAAIGWLLGRRPRRATRLHFA